MGNSATHPSPAAATDADAFEMFPPPDEKPAEKEATIDEDQETIAALREEIALLKRRYAEDSRVYRAKINGVIRFLTALMQYLYVFWVEVALAFMSLLIPVYQKWFFIAIAIVNVVAFVGLFWDINYVHFVLWNLKHDSPLPYEPKTQSNPTPASSDEDEDPADDEDAPRTVTISTGADGMFGIGERCGRIIRRVIPGSPAELNGIRRGDEILAVNGVSVEPGYGRRSGIMISAAKANGSATLLLRYNPQLLEELEDSPFNRLKNGFWATVPSVVTVAIFMFIGMFIGKSK